MKRVQNWRDYLNSDDSEWKQKIPKKKKREEEPEEFNKRTDKKRSKRK